MILFHKKYHTFLKKVSYIFKKVSYFWLMLWGEGAEGVGEEAKEERFWHRTRGGNPRFRGAAPPAPPRRQDMLWGERQHASQFSKF